jgi:formate dehydrogenase iron-sulfur subunit
MAKAMLIDLTKCTGCRACQVACKQWNDLPAENTVCWGCYDNPPDLSPTTWNRIAFYEWDEDDQPKWMFRPVRCFHCTDAPCVTVCPTGALFKDYNGFTAYDESLCNGCGYCTKACPYNVPRLTDMDAIAGAANVTGKGKSSKCVFCQDRVHNDLVPACAQTCAPGAIQYGERGDMVQLGKDRVAELKANGTPEANLYGENLLGGLGMMYVLPKSADFFTDLDKEQSQGNAPMPANPPYQLASFWQKILEPLGIAGVALTLAGLGLNFLIARRSIKIEEEEG